MGKVGTGEEEERRMKGRRTDAVNAVSALKPREGRGEGDGKRVSVDLDAANHRAERWTHDPTVTRSGRPVDPASLAVLDSDPVKRTKSIKTVQEEGEAREE